jgi:hypothetical protein
MLVLSMANGVTGTIHGARAVLGIHTIGQRFARAQCGMDKTDDQLLSGGRCSRLFHITQPAC